VEKPSAEQLDTLRKEGWIKEGAPVWYNAGIYIFKPVLFRVHGQITEISPWANMN
jgi:NDP-sugar pyrophosphorylase family protein